MKILVTGATGFLGTALCARLAAAGHELVKLNSQNCDLNDQNALLAFNGHKYDRIFHLAAWTQAGDFCLTHAGEQWVVNQRINTNVLAWWQKYQPQAKLVALGTSCAYAPGPRLSEDKYLAGVPIDSLFAYAMTKRMLYAGLLALHKQYGLRHLTVVPSTLYGPNYHLDGRQMHFIFDLIRKIVDGQRHGREVVLWGDGRQRRELIFLDDFIEIMLRLTEERDNDLVNVGAGEEHTIRHFAEVICRLVGYDPGRIKYDRSAYVGARSKCLETRKLRGLIPGLRLTPLETGLAQTVDWYLAAVRGQPR